MLAHEHSMEIWDLYTKDKTLTDKTVVRDESIPTGYYHLAVHFWPKDEKGRYLIQKRSNHLLRHPGLWAETGGAVITGETSIDAMKREIFEEIGLNISKKELKLFNSLTRGDSIVDFWTASISSKITKEFVPTDEVAEIDFKYPDEITKMMREGTLSRFPDEYADIVGIKG